MSIQKSHIDIKLSFRQVVKSLNKTKGTAQHIHRECQPPTHLSIHLIFHLIKKAVSPLLRFSTASAGTSSHNPPALAVEDDEDDADPPL